jgi:hypothetical protein
MADVSATVQGFVDAGSAAQQGNWDAAAAAAAPAIESAIEQGTKATKPKSSKPSGGECAAAAAGGALTGAGAGAGIGSAIAPGLGTLIGAGIGALAGALSSSAGAGCFAEEQIDWRAEAKRVWAEAPYYRRVDVAGAALRKGESWTMGPNAAEQRLMRFPIGQRGLKIGTYLFLLRRARELGGGAAEMRRIVSLVAPVPAVTPSTKDDDRLRTSKQYQDAMKVADQLGNNDAGKRLRNTLKNARIGALMQGGFDRVEAERRVLGKAFDDSFIELTSLRKLISDAEPQASYVGPLRSIFGPRAALPATTRAGDVDAGGSSAVLPLAIGAAAVGAFYFLGK